MLKFKKIMCMMIALLLTTNVFLISSAQTEEQNEVFFYSFEDVVNTEEGRGKCDYLSGNYYFMTEDYARTGTKSIGLGNVTDVLTSHSYSESPLKNKSISIWVYDEMLSTATIQNQYLYLQGAKSEIMLGIDSNSSKDKYYVRVIDSNLDANTKNVINGASTYPRSKGWHKLKLDVSGSKLTIYIDGTQIFTYENANDTSLFDITKLSFSIHGSNVTVGGAYFDDLEIKDITVPDFTLSEVTKEDNVVTCIFSSEPDESVMDMIELYDVNGNAVNFTASKSENNIALTTEEEFSDYYAVVSTQATNTQGAHIDKNTYFSTDFSAAEFESFESFTDVENRYSISNVARTGEKSIKLAQYPYGCYTKDYSSAPLTDKEISMWVYDSVSEDKTVAYLYLNCVNKDKTATPEIMLGIHSAAQSNAGKTKYYARTTGVTSKFEGVTDYNRTVGWHKLSVAVSSTEGAKLYIDGTLVHSEAEITSVNKINLWTSSDSIGNSVTYFDDLEIKDINAPSFDLKNVTENSDGTMTAEFSSAPISKISECIALYDYNGEKTEISDIYVNGNKVTFTPSSDFENYEYSVKVTPDIELTDIYGTHIGANEYEKMLSAPEFESFESFTDVENRYIISNVARTGEKSLKLAQYPYGCYTKDYSSAPLTDKEISMWVYDSVSEDKTVAYLYLNCVNKDKTATPEIMLGIHSAAQSNAGKTKYYARTTGVTSKFEGVTDYNRTVGWHKLSVAVSSTEGAKLYIDGTLVHSEAEITSVNKINLWTSSDSIGNSVTYFDDLEIKDINAPSFDLTNVTENSDGTMTAEFSSAPASKINECIALYDYNGEKVEISDITLNKKSVTFTPASSDNYELAEFAVMVTPDADLTDVYGTHIGKNEYIKTLSASEFESFESYTDRTNIYTVNNPSRTGEKSISLLNTQASYFDVKNCSALPLTDKEISIWMYDSMSEEKVVKYLYLLAPVNAENKTPEIMLGISDGAGSNAGKTKYYTRATNVTSASEQVVDYTRTVGWHKLSVAVNSTEGTKLYIDGSLVREIPEITSIAFVKLFSSHVGESTTIYFDDLEIKDINAPAFDITNAEYDNGTLTVSFSGMPDALSTDKLYIENANGEKINATPVISGKTAVFSDLTLGGGEYKAVADGMLCDIYSSHIGVNEASFSVASEEIPDEIKYYLNYGTESQTEINADSAPYGETITCVVTFGESVETASVILAGYSGNKLEGVNLGTPENNSCVVTLKVDGEGTYTIKTLLWKDINTLKPLR